MKTFTRKLPRFVMFVFLLFAAVRGETVHFTNSQSQLDRSLGSNYGDDVKTYRLDVPGSSPITIIEAQPWNSEDSTKGKFLSSDDFSVDYNDRRTKDYLVPGSSHEDHSTNRDVQEKCSGLYCDEIEKNKKTVYSPDLLSKFLKDYADKIKNADYKIKDRLKQMEINAQKSNGGFPGGVDNKNKLTHTIDLKIQPNANRRYSSWDEVDSKKHKHPYDDSEGWVALEAVPWTRSKISKWQANAHKISKPSINYNSFNVDRDTQYSDKFNTHYGRPDEQSDEDSETSFYKFPTPGSISQRPFYESAQNENDWPHEMPSRPSWHKPGQNRPHQYDSEVEGRPHHPDCDHNHHQSISDDYNRRVYSDNGGIITDGRPGDFPSDNSYRKKDMQRPAENIYLNNPRSGHPSSYPSNGNGEWVLLSTTKGYKLPKNRQRSLSITPNAVTSHRSVRLTVLPAVNGSNENMTLSHGGMLEVEPSFYTVEESRRIYERAQKINSTTPKPKKLRRVIATNATPDSSAVMAVVGAGLVPATVAMIMPMVLGRKKRSLLEPYYQISANFPNVTQHPNFDFESTLQRTL